MRPRPVDAGYAHSGLVLDIAELQAAKRPYNAFNYYVARDLNFTALTSESLGIYCVIVALIGSHAGNF